MKANAPSVQKCFQSIDPTKVPAKILVEFFIKPSGGIDAPAVNTAEIKGTPMEACVLAQMKKWKFPESQSTSPPVKFPITLSR